jgi:hypothetical protein
MRRNWPAAAGAILLFVTITAMVSFYAARLALRATTVKHYTDTVFAESKYPPPPATIQPLIAELRHKQHIYGGDELSLLLTDLLSYQAWCYPDEGVAPLREAIHLAEELYPRVEYGREYLGERLAFCYAYAGLPDKVERWQGEAARQPALRLKLRLYLIYARLGADAPDAARQVAQDELARAPTPDNQALALASCVILGDQAGAAQYEQGYLQAGSPPAELQLLYGLWLQSECRFSDAGKVLRALPSATKLGPEDAANLLVSEAALHGFDTPEAQRLLLRATESTRNPMDAPAVRAWTLSALANYTGESRWWAELEQLARAEAGYHCPAAAAAALLDQPENCQLPPPARALGYARTALQNAELPSQRQFASLLLARAEVASGNAQAGLTRLRQALGDPAVEDPVLCERLPEYELFLLDDSVRSLRGKDKDFDQGVHQAVQAYLSRRSALFKAQPSAAADAAAR